ncbi:helix-turn-helix domain-containing protein [Namhaeicola litoreus]|uniref:Helix-turn-helix domain-containing protein n=1 Tax=Namhaeicola litoreus TaxID=1052145 RepID=A0ABW3Y025_9FLAO
MSENTVTQVHNISPLELKEYILEDFREELKLLAKNFQPVKPTEYITRQEARKLLKVSLATLSEWNKKGIIKPYRLGNLIRYKRAELDQALIKINH